LAEPRPSLSPSKFSEGRYQEFVKNDAKAFNEDAVKDSVLPAMLRAMDASNGAQKNILFINTAPMVEGISQAKPDYYYGTQPELIHSDVRNSEQLSRYIIPSNHTNLPAVPNVSLEAKGPDGSFAEALRQASHNGAIGERAIHSLETYGQDPPVYNNNAHTISSIYHGGQLKIYSHSVAQPNGPGTQPEYYMHQVNGWSMTGNQNSFLQGATAFKNALDLTAEYRNDAITHANKIAQSAEGEGDEDTEEEQTVEDEAEANSSNTMPSLDRRTTNAIVSTVYEDEDEDSDDSETSVEDEDSDDSETSVEEEAQRRLPSKRSSSKSHRSQQRQKRETGTSNPLRSKATTGSDKQKRSAWFGW
jgi:hypothetical protein